ncbi:MAG: 3-oxoacyl-ACP reductase [SAR324 cluster bacterium]|nr:3-oxoacyl-ACP reductase [SAR324 cluster bacterium]
MSDFLLELGKNPQARKWIKSLGLPIPMPQALERDQDSWKVRILANQQAGVYVAAGSFAATEIATTLAEAGASLHVAGDSKSLKAFNEPTEAYGQPIRKLDISGNISDNQKFKVLVFDATGISSPEEFKQVYDFFHPLATKMEKSGRIVIVGCNPSSIKADISRASVQGALSGFTRSIAKEIGNNGSIAQLIYVSEDCVSRLPGALRFFMSPRSAYISGQPVTLSNTAKASKDKPAWTSQLDGKVALVTGAARGIGAATAKILAREGARVVCLDRPADDGPASQLAREINGDVLLVDVTQADAPQQISDYLKKTYGGVDIVVHNAGITRDKTIARMTPEYWNQAVDVNLGAVLRITEQLLKGTLRDEGRIICLSSIAGIAGNRGQTNYSASKAGIIGFVRHLSKLVADQGITVNAIAPGFIETRLTEAIPVAIREVGRRMNNLGQGGQPEDVGQAIAFLATPGAQGVTGEVIRVCGGAILGA